MGYRSLILLFILCAIPFSGCLWEQDEQLIAESEEKHYQRGQRLLREGREEEALSAFLKVTEKRPDAPDSHLEAGRLYDAFIGDPIAAIYHYRRYLELKPSAEQSPMVRQLIETSKKKFARQLPAQPFNNDIDRLDLLELIKEIKAENDALKQELANAKGQISNTRIQSSAAAANSSSSSRSDRIARASVEAPNSSSRNSNASTSQTPAVEVPQAPYDVVTGDTLSKISTKVYGHPGRWMDIYQANRDTLPSPHSLKVGQTLRIP